MLELAITTATLIISVAVLLKSSEKVMNSSVKLSTFFNISQLAVGFILVALATSLPELAVSILSSTSGEGAIAAGNIFGSNISNILLIIGAGAFIHGIRISPQNMKETGILLLLTTIVSAYIVFSSFTQQSALGVAEGMILLGIFGVYVFHTMRGKQREGKKPVNQITKKQALNSFLLFSAGIIVVIVSSGFVVDSAVRLAELAGLAQSFIGATIIAVGTSLPELSIFLQSIARQRYALALGNIIGSNVVNLTLILGSAAVINPIEVHLPVFAAALLFAVVANMALLYSAAVNKGMKRLGGAIFLLAYVLYIVVIFALQVKELGM